MTRESVLSLYQKSRPKSHIFHNQCLDFVVLTHRFVTDLQFSTLIPRNVDTFSFKAFPSIVQQAIVESTSVDFLFLREYWNYFTQSDWCLLMTDFVRVLQ
jgi:hypothetical protein